MVSLAMQKGTHFAVQVVMAGFRLNGRPGVNNWASGGSGCADWKHAAGRSVCSSAICRCEESVAMFCFQERRFPTFFDHKHQSITVELKRV